MFIHVTNLYFNKEIIYSESDNSVFKIAPLIIYKKYSIIKKKCEIYYTGYLRAISQIVRKLVISKQVSRKMRKHKL